MYKPHRATGRLLLAVTVAIGVLAGSWVLPQFSFGPSVADNKASSSAGSGTFSQPGLSDDVAALRITDRSPVGYDRDLFPHWRDPDGNGCDARNDVLQRDLDGVVLRDGSDCIVESGVLHDPYTGTKIEFKRGASTSSAVQIDHVVPLSAAWSGGANTWTPEQREAFANDPENLIAVDGPTNSAKSDSLPGEWMPTNDAFHCEYVARVVHVAKKYNLAVTEMDRDVMAEHAQRCS